MAINPINNYAPLLDFSEMGYGQTPASTSQMKTVRMPELVVTAPRKKGSKRKASSTESKPAETKQETAKTEQRTTAAKPAPGYDVNRGLEIMDAVTQAYPGINPETAAAVAGNFLYESYGLPNIYEGQNPSNAGTYVPETGGVGLAQWTGPRRRALMAMENPLTLDTQMQYFVQENAGPESRAWEQVLAAPDLPSATRTFTTKWERAGIPAIDRRINLAEQVLDAYGARNSAEMERQAQLLQPVPLSIDQPVIRPESTMPVNLMVGRQPVALMQQRVPTIADVIGYPSPDQAVSIPYNMTAEGRNDVLRRMYKRSGYSDAQIDAMIANGGY